jgi:hypothetical protein
LLPIARIAKILGLETVIWDLYYHGMSIREIQRQLFDTTLASIVRRSSAVGPDPTLEAITSDS